MMRILRFTMTDWVIGDPVNFIAGNIGENKATKIEIGTAVESDCAYTLDFMIGKMTKASAVLAVDGNTLSYTLPSTVTKSLQLSMQVVGTYTTGMVIKSNIVKCRLGESINAVEQVTPTEATAFQEALAVYAGKLDQAISSATNAAASATSAGQAKTAAEQAMTTATVQAGKATTEASKAENEANKAATKATAAETSVNTIAGYADLVAAAKAAAAESASLASSKANMAKTYAENAEKSAIKASNAADIRAAIYTHNQSRSAHPDIISRIPDVSKFITRNTEDLVWYYRKSQTYTKAEVNELISAVPKFSRRVVTELPTSDISDTTIYLMQATDPQERNYFVEYIYVNDAWEIIGGQTIDLSGYAAKTWVDTQIDEHITSMSVYTKAEIDELLNGISDRLSALEELGGE